MNRTNTSAKPLDLLLIRKGGLLRFVGYDGSPGDRPLLLNPTYHGALKND